MYHRTFLAALLSGLLTVAAQAQTAPAQPTDSTRSIVIRCRPSSLAPAESPLMVVDGNVYEKPLSDLNPADIAEITILRKDQLGMISCYGPSRDVIIITTKAYRRPIHKPMSVKPLMPLSELQ